MKPCIFCQIVKGEKPCYKIYEDDQYLAFLDTSPHHYGHTLVVPKTHYPHVWDMDNPGSLLNVAQKLVAHYQTIITAPDYFVAIWGRKVGHAHLHLMPQLPPGGDLAQIAAQLELP